MNKIEIYKNKLNYYLENGNSYKIEKYKYKYDDLLKGGADDIESIKKKLFEKYTSLNKNIVLQFSNKIDPGGFNRAYYEIYTKEKNNKKLSYKYYPLTDTFDKIE